ncbi:tetratricopeptide repeat protein [Silicimonas sp. MF1-12-2]|uniref:tetratricopeptide repeat protein n=1 Tax=Silicimonas sp. MF1-12-2 TaxID=3384793 RepID=UPI0039B42A83
MTLDPASVDLARSSDSQSTLFEDLDIRDPEFENWLRDIRISHLDDAACPFVVPRRKTGALIARKPQTVRPLIVFRTTRELGVDDAWFYVRFRECVATTIGEMGEVDFVDLSDPNQKLDANGAPMLFVSVEIAKAQDTSLISARIESAGGQVMWRSRLSEIGMPADDETSFRIACLGSRVCQALGDCLNDDRHMSNVAQLPISLACRGRAQIFDFSRKALIEADRLFEAAYTLDSNPVYLAWRAFIRNTAAFEHLTNDFLDPLDNEELITVALREAPGNSLVLSFAAQHSLVHQGDFAYGELLCEKAIRANEANALSWAFRANILTVQRRYEEALAAAEKGVSLASGRALRNFMSIFSCMARIGKGDYDLAATHAQFASTLSPEFIAIRRFLFALYAANDRPEKAETIQQEIRLREPDFDKGKLLSRRYPVSTLQATNIMDRL